MMLKIYLDDKRPAPVGWVLVYWPEDAICFLRMGNVTHISLDHDLGDDSHGTGYDVLTWIEEQVACHGFIPPRIAIHTANVSARQKMCAARESIYALKRRNNET